jgi:hypothetical protein
LEVVNDLGQINFKRRLVERKTITRRKVIFLERRDFSIIIRLKMKDIN